MPEEIVNPCFPKTASNCRSIKRGAQQILTHVLTFNKPSILNEIIGFMIERVEQYIPNTLRCFKSQKYWHHKKSCR